MLRWLMPSKIIDSCSRLEIVRAYQLQDILGKYKLFKQRVGGKTLLKYSASLIFVFDSKIMRQGATTFEY